MGLGLLTQLFDAAGHAFPIVEGAGGDAAEVGLHRVAGGLALVVGASGGKAAGAGEVVAVEAAAIEGTAVERGAERLEAACHDRAPLGGVHVSLCTPELLVSFWTQK